MKPETRQWIHYAQENHQAASLMLDHGLLNLCLQNGQQAVEKLLKALLVESGLPLKRTHSIRQADIASPGRHVTILPLIARM